MNKEHYLEELVSVLVVGESLVQRLLYRGVPPFQESDPQLYRLQKDPDRVVIDDEINDKIRGTLFIQVALQRNFTV